MRHLTHEDIAGIEAYDGHTIDRLCAAMYANMMAAYEAEDGPEGSEQLDYARVKGEFLTLSIESISYVLHIAEFADALKSAPGEAHLCEVLRSMDIVTLLLLIDCSVVLSSDEFSALRTGWLFNSGSGHFEVEGISLDPLRLSRRVFVRDTKRLQRALLNAVAAAGWTDSEHTELINALCQLVAEGRRFNALSDELLGPIQPRRESVRIACDYYRAVINLYARAFDYRYVYSVLYGF